MTHPLFPVSVVMRRVPLVNRWISEKWELAEVRPDSGATQIAQYALADSTWLWRGFALDLHPSEGEGYYLNMSAPDPRVFVMWRLEEWEGIETARPWVTTASYHEAARMMDGGETVDSVPIPAPIRDWLTPWLEANYQPEPRRKKRRNEAFWREGPNDRSAPVKEPER
ncbi:MAG: DUF3305 domain-containing protein [Casimicrobiaceae bacterium]